MTHQTSLVCRLISAASSLVFGLALLFLARSFVLAQTDIFKMPTFTLLDVAYSPNSLYLTHVYADGRLEVIDTASGDALLSEVASISNPLLRARVDWSPDSKRLAAGIGSHVYIWQMEETPQLVATLEAGVGDELVYNESGYYMPEGITSLAWNSDISLLLTQSLSSRYTVWSREQERYIFDEIIGNNPIPVIWHPDGKRIFDGRSTLDIYTQKRFANPAEQIPWVTSQCSSRASMTINTDSSRVAIGTVNGCVVIVDAGSGNQIAAYKLSADNIPIWDVIWSPDSLELGAVTEQGSLYVIDVATGRFVVAAQTNAALYAVDWASDNSAITYGGHTTNGIALATIDVADVTALMSSEAVQQPAFSSTPEANE